ncbi:RDD family protein [Legionella spiritensis]|uniref:RDD family protein n=1 Tax=Legionella spiritensis TaxID=452 RepID=A0A0W0Z6E2_LEGSP|nr:RDD family protein [Legionella spiritensis]KTD64689.1 RDD family protein [Legionella spiritensis]SNV47892.1 RDD family [Legionella spiritensis]
MWFRYVAALFYDLLIALSLLMAVTALCVWANGHHAIPPASRWYQGCMLLTLASYYALSIKAGGQTIGMRAWKLQILDGKNQRPGFIAITGRLTLTLPAWLFAVIRWKNPQLLLLQWTNTKLGLVDRP